MKHKLTTKKISHLSSTLVSSVSLFLVLPASAATINFLGGNLATAANWDGGVLPGSGDIGTVNVNGTLNIGNNLGGWISGPDLVYDNGAVITINNGDYGHSNGNPTSTFNNATINVADDIFANSAVITFNAGSSANVGDRLDANGGGTLTINGGTHASNLFGAQRGSVTNFLGGTVTMLDSLATTAGNAGTPAGGTINVGGSATGSSVGVSLDASGFIEFSSAWTGSLTATGLSGTDWQTALNGTTATLDGVAIDATVFANNFQLTDGGQTLSLVAIPEPSSALLLSLGGLGLFMRCRR